jgi:hypothetical protein
MAFVFPPKPLRESLGKRREYGLPAAVGVENATKLI